MERSNGLTGVDMLGDKGPTKDRYKHYKWLPQTKCVSNLTGHIVTVGTKIYLYTSSSDCSCHNTDKTFLAFLCISIWHWTLAKTVAVTEFVTVYCLLTIWTSVVCNFWCRIKSKCCYKWKENSGYIWIYIYVSYNRHSPRSTKTVTTCWPLSP